MVPGGTPPLELTENPTTPKVSDIFNLSASKEELLFPSPFDRVDFDRLHSAGKEGSSSRARLKVFEWGPRFFFACSLFNQFRIGAGRAYVNIRNPLARAVGGISLVCETEGSPADSATANGLYSAELTIS